MRLISWIHPRGSETNTVDETLVAVFRNRSHLDSGAQQNFLNSIRNLQRS
jgi:hypothetical protein